MNFSDGLTIRLETREDFADIDRVVRAAFGPEPVHKLVRAIRASDGYVPALALVAELAGQVVGHVMISYATLKTDEGEDEIALLSPLAVDPAHQRRGIGGALVKSSTVRAGAKGEPCVMLEGDPGYYGRFGFEAANRYAITMPLPSWASLEAAQIMWLAGVPEQKRGSVIYPPAFDVVAA